VVYGNVPNLGLVDNLPPDCIVEVPCLLDLEQIWALVDELLEAHRDWLPESLLAQPAGSVAGACLTTTSMANQFCPSDPG
jgi:alpha-galactosidase/6-phospho-beta-glucosidase family protein